MIPSTKTLTGTQYINELLAKPKFMTLGELLAIAPRETNCRFRGYHCKICQFNQCDITQTVTYRLVDRGRGAEWHFTGEGDFECYLRN
jgi:Gpi18-like mannosyltransferase